MAALPFVASGSDALHKEASNILRSALGSRKSGVSNAAIRTLVHWSEKSLTEKTKFPRLLSAAIVALCDSRISYTLVNALEASQILLERGHIKPLAATKLEKAVEKLAKEITYDLGSTIAFEELSVSLVRRACVRTAGALLSTGSTSQILGTWVEDSRMDPLPEVRFASDSDSFFF